MLRPSPNHGTQRLPNDDDDDSSSVVREVLARVRIPLALAPIWNLCNFMNQVGPTLLSCQPQCLSEATLTAVGPFYLVAIPGEVKYPTHGVNH